MIFRYIQHIPCTKTQCGIGNLLSCLLRLLRLFSLLQGLQITDLARFESSRLGDRWIYDNVWHFGETNMVDLALLGIYTSFGKPL
jgi:hypothetical protein